MPVIFYEENDFRLIKSRIADSYSKTGSSGGYRIFFIIDRLKSKTVFIHLYPKRGKLEGNDINVFNDIKVYLNAFLKEVEENQLIKLNIYDNLEMIAN